VAKIGRQNTNNLPKFWKVPAVTTCAFQHKCWARYLQKGRSKFDRCGTRCGSRSESVGRADFQQATMVCIKTGMSWGNFPRLPLTFVNIIISLLVNFRSIFCWKCFWAPDQHFVGWREYCILFIGFLHALDVFCTTLRCCSVDAVVDRLNET
jgi:hypothetical protein